MLKLNLTKLSLKKVFAYERFFAIIVIALLGYSQAVRQLALNQPFREFESLYPSLIRPVNQVFYFI